MVRIAVRHEGGASTKKSLRVFAVRPVPSFRGFTVERNGARHRLSTLGRPFEDRGHTRVRLVRLTRLQPVRLHQAHRECIGLRRRFGRDNLRQPLEEGKPLGRDAVDDHVAHIEILELRTRRRSVQCAERIDFQLGLHLVDRRARIRALRGLLHIAAQQHPAHIGVRTRHDVVRGRLALPPRRHNQVFAAG